MRLLHGQRIIFCDEACKSTFLTDPSSYFTAEGERVCQQASSKPQGDWLSKKDYEQFKVWCPGCNTALQVDNTTPRVHLLNGQTLFFRCYECVVNFLTKPERFFAHCGKPCDIKEQGLVQQMEGVSLSDQPPFGETSKGGKLSGKEQGVVIHPGEVACPSREEKEHGKQSKEEWTEEKLERCQRKHHHSFKPTEKSFKTEPEGKALCPGCGQQVHFEQPAGPTLFVEFLGNQRIFFCSEACVDGFADNPMKLLKAAKSFRHKETDFLNLEGFIMICPTCEGRKMPLSTATPRWRSSPPCRN